MAFCTKCGSENRDGAKFCKQCGAPLGAQSGAEEPEARPQAAAEPVQAAAKPTVKPAAQSARTADGPKRSVSRRAVIGGACAVGVAALAGGILLATRPSDEPEAEAETESTGAENVATAEEEEASEVVPASYYGGAASKYGVDEFLLLGLDVHGNPVELALVDGAGAKLLSIPTDVVGWEAVDPWMPLSENAYLCSDGLAVGEGSRGDYAVQFYSLDGEPIGSFDSVAGFAGRYVHCLEAVEGVDSGGTDSVIYSAEGEELLRFRGVSYLTELASYGQGWCAITNAGDPQVLCNVDTGKAYLTPGAAFGWEGEPLPVLETFASRPCGNFYLGDRMVLCFAASTATAGYELWVMDASGSISEMQVDFGEGYYGPQLRGVTRGYAVFDGGLGPASVDLSSGQVYHASSATQSRSALLAGWVADRAVLSEQGADGNQYMALVTLQMADVCDPVRADEIRTTNRAVWALAGNTCTGYDSTGAEVGSFEVRDDEGIVSAGSCLLVVTGEGRSVRLVAAYGEDGQVVVDGSPSTQAQRVVTAGDLEAVGVEVDNSAGQV